MTTPKIAFLAPAQADVSVIDQQLAGIDHELEVHVCTSPGETIEAVKGAEVVISGGVPVTKEVIDEMDATKAILGVGHGFDFIDHYAATDKAIMVANNAGFCTDEVANHAIMLLLACAKNLTVLHNKMRDGRWESPLGSLPLPPITEQVLGLIGFGNIARATARRAFAFNLGVIAYDPYAPQWAADEYRIELVGSLDELAARSDFVSMHTPLNRETERMLDAAFFKAMKPTAYFINTCRGRTVDEAALTGALERGEIAGAGLDVFEQEPTPAGNRLLKMDNVIATPHSAGASDVSMTKAMVNIGREAARILRGTWPMSLVNPEVRSSLPSRSAAVNA